MTIVSVSESDKSQEIPADVAARLRDKAIQEARADIPALWQPIYERLCAEWLTPRASVAPEPDCDGLDEPAPSLAPVDPSGQGVAPTQPLRQKALELVASGKALIPLYPNSKTPILTAWQHAKLDTAEKVNAMFDAYGDCNLAIEPEDEGLCVIDADLYHESVPERLAELGLPPTQTVTTPRGGKHLYYIGSLRATVGKEGYALGPGIDTRGRGSYVLIPPSVIDGKPYVLTDDRPAVALPLEIESLTAARQQPITAAPDIEPDLSWNVARARSHLAQCVKFGTLAIEGQRGDDTAFEVACDLHDLGISPTLAEKLMLELWYPHCQPNDQPEFIQAKVASAYKYAQNAPGAYAIAKSAADTFAHVLPNLHKWLEDHPPEHIVLPLPAKHMRVSGQNSDEIASDIGWDRRRTATFEPLAADEIEEMLSTTKFKRKKNPHNSALWAFVTAALRRGHTPHEIFDMMMANLDMPHLVDIKKGDTQGTDAAGDGRALVERICATLADDFDRVVVKINAGQEARAVDEVEAALLQRNVPIFVNGSKFVYPGEITFKDRTGADTTTLRLLPLSGPAFANMTSRDVQFEKYNRKEGAWTPTDCPKNLADNFLRRAGAHRMRPVTGITMIPVLRADGTILETAGYDVDTGLIYYPAGVTFPSIPNAPSKEEAQQALKFLLDPFREYQFADTPSQSVLLSMLLSLMVRRIVEHVPLHGISAPVRGSGKGKLVECAAQLATGRPADQRPLPDTDEEFRKSLVAALSTGAPLISYDNVTKQVGSPTLASALTSASMSDRLLGRNDQTIDVVNNAVIVANGNNLAVSSNDDMERRAVLCTIDPGVEHPERRKFDFDPVQMFESDRARYVAACLTILRAYILAGRPRMCDPLGSFEEWSNLVVGSLMWAGEANPIETQAALIADDPVAMQMSHLFGCIAAVMGSRPFTVKVLLQTLQGPGIETTPSTDGQQGDTEARGEQVARDALREALLDLAPAHANRVASIDPKALGKLLARYERRLFGGRRVVREGMTDGQARWKLYPG